jgi:hypothetical protein
VWGAGVFSDGIRALVWGAEMSKPKRRVMDAAHLQVDYGSLSKTETRGLVATQGAELVAEARAIDVNRDLQHIDVVMLPSVHRMVNNAYSVIDSELRRLQRESMAGGLSKTDTTQFERYAASLVRLVNMERSVRNDSDVDAMSDEELTKKVLAKLRGDNNG